MMETMPPTPTTYCIRIFGEDHTVRITADKVTASQPDVTSGQRVYWVFEFDGEEVAKISSSLVESWWVEDQD